MKKIFNILFISSMAMTIWSCEDEDLTRIPDTSDGANLRVQFSSPTQSFLNLLELEASALEYSLYSENKNIDVVNVYMTFVDFSADTSSFEVLWESFSQADFDAGNGVITRGYTSNELAVLVGLGSFSDLDGGDFFNFRNEIILTDGRTYPSTQQVGGTPVSNVSNNITQATGTASFTTTWFAFVGCPSEIVAGKYIMNPTDAAAPCSNDAFGQAPGLAVDKEVDITQTGVVFFQFSDVALEYYVGFGFDEEQPHIFLDVCNTLLNSSAQGQFNIVGTGNHDPETNIFNIQWIDLGNATITCENTLVPATE